MNQRNILFAIAISVVALLGASGGYFIGSLPITGLQATISVQNTTIRTLENIINQLTNQVFSLQAEANKVPALQQQLNNLQIDKNNLTNQVSSLNVLVYKLQEQINGLHTNITSLSAQVDSLQTQIRTLNAELTEKDEIISEMLLRIEEKYNVTGVDGIYILNYTITYGQIGMDQTYTADIVLYNALSTATVQVKVYGSDWKIFTYVILTGATIHKIENWKGDMWARSYSNIVIESVIR